jgi:hypothetical protein
MKPIVERAFELARSGAFTQVTPLKKKLAAEGYDPRLISGHNLIRSLGDACRLATGGQVKEPAPRRKLLSPEQRSAAAKRGAETRLERLRSEEA